MSTYVIHNLDADPILLQFTGGPPVRVRPGGLYIWRGPDANLDNLDYLLGHVKAGRLDVKGFPESAALVNWLREGF